MDQEIPQDPLANVDPARIDALMVEVSKILEECGLNVASAALAPEDGEGVRLRPLPYDHEPRVALLTVLDVIPFAFSADVLDPVQAQVDQSVRQIDAGETEATIARLREKHEKKKGPE